jgi:biopolymer transport protein ExbB/TolQ
VAAFRRETHPLALFLKHQKYEASPVYKIYEGACMAVGLEIDVAVPEDPELYLKDMSAKVPRLNAMQLGAIRNAAERAVADQALLLEDRMGFLATAVSASPLLGLLGTVWGVMDSFVSMAIRGSVNISAVAPGIAGALLTTVVGLLVALPSAIGYNLLTNRIRHLCVQMDNFTDELVAELQRKYAHD